MLFYFPDSQDQIDPSFDLATESRADHRIRQRDDRYAHEVLSAPAYDGMLVSKGIVDGISHGGGKYTFAQRQRLFRLGAHEFFRVEDDVPIMGDCGGFSYVNDDEPPYSVDEVLDFYEGIGFDEGISVDHVILGYIDNAKLPSTRQKEVPQDWANRQTLTLELAAEFLRKHRSRKCSFEPLGVAQGWDPPSYAIAVDRLQKIGYTRIALGGMVPLKTPEIIDCLTRIDTIRKPRTELHILGVTRSQHVLQFHEFGVTSFDSTSPFMQAFKDDTDNYYTLGSTYTAVRVPQVDGNSKLKRRILAGQVPQREAIRLERACMSALESYDARPRYLDGVLDLLDEYHELIDARSRRDEYRRTLEARPWLECGCGVCRTAGIHVAIFRGSERNKRRGFHNLHVFRLRLDEHLAGRTIAPMEEALT